MSEPRYVNWAGASIETIAAEYETDQICRDYNRRASEEGRPYVLPRDVYERSDFWTPEEWAHLDAAFRAEEAERAQDRLTGVRRPDGSEDAR